MRGTSVVPGCLYKVFGQRESVGSREESGSRERVTLHGDGRQLTAARALAGLTVVELAKEAGVATRTIHRLEIGGVNQVAEKKRHGHVSRDVIARIVGALARQGVELLPEGGGYGSGVRWKLPRAVRRALSPP